MRIWTMSLTCLNCFWNGSKNKTKSLGLVQKGLGIKLVSYCQNISENIMNNQSILDTMTTTKSISNMDQMD